MKLYTAPALPAVTTTPATPDSSHGLLYFKGSTLYQKTSDGSELPVGGAAAASLPVGAILEWPSSVPPANWLICDGSTKSRSIYSDLYAALGGASSPWGQGDGSTTFTLPDLRGRTAIGAGLAVANGATTHSLGEIGGEETHKLTVVETPSHTHSTAVTGPYGTTSTTAYNDANNVFLSTGRASTSNFTSSSAGGNGAHNNMQPYTTINYIIFTGLGSSAETGSIGGNSAGSVHLQGAWSTSVPTSSTGTAFTIAASGTYLCMLQFSAYATSSGNIRQRAYLDGVLSDDAQYYFNQTSIHKTMPPLVFSADLTVGTHRIAPFLATDAVAGYSNTGDYGTFTWIGFPGPDASNNTDWVNATLQGTWVPFDNANYTTASYIREGSKIYLRGLVKNSSSAISTIFTLPVGFRPSKIQLLSVNTSESLGRVHITPDGQVSMQHGTPSTWLSLDEKYFFIN